MKKITFHLIISGVLSVFIATCAFAFSQQEQEIRIPVGDLAALAKKVEKTAAEHGARVFLMARVGRPVDELPPGVSYTHVSFGVYSSINLEDGRTVPGYAVYNLYQLEQDPARSHLVVDFPVDFFGGAHVPRAGVIIPTPRLQERLLQVIGSDTYRLLHNPEYSAFSNPYNLTYQNCTEFVLDVLNAAIYQTGDIQQLKRNTKEYFRAQDIHINPFKLFFASIFMPDIRTADQDGTIQTTTYDMIAAYLEKYGLVQAEMDVELDSF